MTTLNVLLSNTPSSIFDDSSQKLYLLAAIITIIASGFHVLSTSGSYQKINEVTWTPKWSTKGDNRFIIGFNIVVLLSFVFSNIFEVAKFEIVQTVIAFIIVCVISICAVKIIRYNTDIKKERPSAY